MSIIIKTMTNLPEHCYDCPCHDGESGCCQADKEHRYSDYRPFWCPLSETSSVDTVTEFADHCRECGSKYGKFLKFAEWVAAEIFDDVMWELNKDAFAELACRKLEKLGLVRANGDEWELVESQESEVRE